MTREEVPPRPRDLPGTNVRGGVLYECPETNQRWRTRAGRLITFIQYGPRDAGGRPTIVRRWSA